MTNTERNFTIGQCAAIATRYGGLGRMISTDILALKDAPQPAKPQQAQEMDEREAFDEAACRASCDSMCNGSPGLGGNWPCIKGRIYREQWAVPQASGQAAPSDDEIGDLAREHFIIGSYHSFARALLSRYGRAPAASAEPVCWCEACRPITMEDMRMVLCPTCGNKRCPHATDHRNACTGSNEPGQKGSSYERCAAPVATQAPAVPEGPKVGQRWLVKLPHAHALTTHEVTQTGTAAICLLPVGMPRAFPEPVWYSLADIQMVECLDLPDDGEKA